MNDQCRGPGGHSIPGSAERDRRACRRGRRTRVPVGCRAPPSARRGRRRCSGCARDRDEGAVVQGERRGRGVDVAGLAEERLALVGAGGEDAGHLAPGDEPDDVEVVHAAVAEEPAGRSAGTPACGGAWSIVVARTVWTKPSSPDDDRVARPPVAGVEAALEPDLHRHVRVARLELGEARASRSRSSATGFSQNVGMSRAIAASSRLGVGRGARGDDERVEPRVEQRADARCRRSRRGRTPRVPRGRCRGRRARGSSTPCEPR